MNTHAKILIAVVLILALLLGAAAGGYFWYRSAHIKVDGIIYEKDMANLDLRGQNISAEHFHHLQEAFPNCSISWDVPFQNTVYADDITEISVTSLTEEDVKQLQYFKNLQTVNAVNCPDFEMIMLLQKSYPQCNVDYSVEIAGETQGKDTASLSFPEGKGDFHQLMEKLQYLPKLKTVHFEEPGLMPEELNQLTEKYPHIQFSWVKTVFGQQLPSDTRELDISGMNFESVEEVEKQAGYLPGLEKLTMCDTKLPYDDIAAFREHVRGKCKVIFNVKIGQFNVRTDETWFMPTKFHKDVKDKDVQNLKYCEDMICIDLGHNVMKNLEWVKGTPHLKYLIVADGPLQDVTPLGTLKELKFLELFMTDIRDISPLVGCTALEDLNVARIPADVRPLAEMTWLKNLWISGGRVPKEDVAYLQEKLPNTHIDAALHHNCTGRGWRQSQNYIDMRNMVGMPIFAE